MQNVTEKQLRDMLHAIGWREPSFAKKRHYAYRNFFSSPCENPDWEDLINKGLAVREERYHACNAPSSYVYYALTESGFALLSEIKNCEFRRPIKNQCETRKPNAMNR